MPKTLHIFLLAFALVLFACQTSPDNSGSITLEEEGESGLSTEPSTERSPEEVIEKTAPVSNSLNDILPYEIGEPRDLSPEAQLAYQAEWDHFDYLSKQMDDGKLPSSFDAEDQAFLRNFDETRSQNISYIGTLGDSWYNAGGPYKLSASSTLAPSPPNSYYPDNAHDFDISTAWIEGVEGYGEGEYVDYFFQANSPPVTEVLIYNGYLKSISAWKNNSRVKTLKLYVDNKPKAILHLEDKRGVQKFQLGEELQSKSGDLVLRFEITEVYKGDKYADTGFAELEFDGTGVLCFGAGTMITMADHSQKAIEKLKIGDEILAWDAISKETINTEVLRLGQQRHTDLQQIKWLGGEIITTPDHPFWIEGKAWAVLAPETAGRYEGFDTLARIEIGDNLVLASGESVRVEAIEKIETPQMTYSITQLAQGKGFFANGVLVGVESLKLAY
ncbi:MAG: Hint domain-containing protein [Bacteroidia bacterium]